MSSGCNATGNCLPHNACRNHTIQRRRASVCGSMPISSNTVGERPISVFSYAVIISPRGVPGNCSMVSICDEQSSLYTVGTFSISNSCASRASISNILTPESRSMCHCRVRRKSAMASSSVVPRHAVPANAGFKTGSNSRSHSRYSWSSGCTTLTVTVFPSLSRARCDWNSSRDSQGSSSKTGYTPAREQPVSRAINSRTVALGVASAQSAIAASSRRSCISNKSTREAM
jgi:hypothetical protein